VAEHSELPGVEAESGETFGEPPVRVGAQLYQQKAGTPAQPPRRGRLHAGGIFGHLADGTARLELFII
jgi:hypothetical protein